MSRFLSSLVVAAGLFAAFASSGCGGAGTSGGSGNDWYYHWSCNGDSNCLSTNPTGQPSGTSGPISGGQVGCNELMTFGKKNWSIPPATQSCDNSPNAPAAKLVSLSVTPPGPSIAIGSTQQFTATASYSDGSTKDVTASATWTSSATNVASIGSGGLATGVSVGSTTITASYSGASATTPLTVTVSFSMTGFSPGGGAPGTAITIAGTNFPTGSGAVTVKVCGTAVPLVSASATQLVVDAPTPTAGVSTAVSTTAACTVSVTTSQGTVTAAAPFQVLSSDVPAVYFLEGGAAGSVMAIAKAGGTAITLASGLLYPSAIAATPWAVYWLQGTATGELNMVGAGGGAATHLATCNGTATVGLAVDGAGDAFCGTTSGLAIVQPGSAAATTLAPTAHASVYDSIATSGASVYWTERQLGGSTGTIRQIPTSGGAATTLASGGNLPTGVAVDSTSVYWVGNGAVQKVPLSGGNPVTLATLISSGSLVAVAVDSSYFYWAQSGPGHIYKVPLGGGTPVTVVTAPGYPGHIGGMALDATNLYWTDQGGLETMPKGGGTITTLVSGLTGGGAVAVTP